MSAILRQDVDSKTAEVNQLRRDLDTLRKAAADVVRVWESPSWNWSHTGSAADAMNALQMALAAAGAKPS